MSGEPWQSGNVTLYCRKVPGALEVLTPDSIDAVVTDPPYDLTAGSRNGSPRQNNPDTPFGRHPLQSGGFMGKQWDATGVAFQPETWRAVGKVLKPGAHLIAFGGTRTYHRMACAIEDADFELRDCLMWLYGSGFPKSLDVGKTLPQWQGWGTALKPAYEPIILARKPLSERNVAANVMKWGTGAVNIDSCRIDFASEADELGAKEKNQHGVFGSGPTNNQVFGKFSKDRDNYDASGRWPANVLHDGSAEVVGLFPGTEARFYYSAKASREERNRGLEGFEEKPLHWSSGHRNPGTFQAEGTYKAARNNHPTVKPIDLMRYLIRLITPPGATVLDCFAGSGSTAVAAIQEGAACILIEREPEYLPIIKARVSAAQAQLPLFGRVA